MKNKLLYVSFNERNHKHLPDFTYNYVNLEFSFIDNIIRNKIVNCTDLEIHYLKTTHENLIHDITEKLITDPNDPFYINNAEYSHDFVFGCLNSTDVLAIRKKFSDIIICSTCATYSPLSEDPYFIRFCISDKKTTYNLAQWIIAESHRRKFKKYEVVFCSEGDRWDTGFINDFTLGLNLILDHMSDEDKKRFVILTPNTHLDKKRCHKIVDNVIVDIDNKFRSRSPNIDHTYVIYLPNNPTQFMNNLTKITKQNTHKHLINTDEYTHIFGNSLSQTIDHGLIPDNFLTIHALSSECNGVTNYNWLLRNWYSINDTVIGRIPACLELLNKCVFIDHFTTFTYTHSRDSFLNRFRNTYGSGGLNLVNGMFELKDFDIDIKLVNIIRKRNNVWKTLRDIIYKNDKIQLTLYISIVNNGADFIMRNVGVSKGKLRRVQGAIIKTKTVNPTSNEKIREILQEVTDYWKKKCDIAFSDANGKRVDVKFEIQNETRQQVSIDGNNIFNASWIHGHNTYNLANDTDYQNVVGDIRISFINVRGFPDGYSILPNGKDIEGSTGSSAGDITINGDPSNWSLSDSSGGNKKKSLKWILAHELGHALGLDDKPERNILGTENEDIPSIMTPTMKSENVGNKKFTHYAEPDDIYGNSQWEIDELRRLYMNYRPVLVDYIRISQNNQMIRYATGINLLSIVVNEVDEALEAINEASSANSFTVRNELVKPSVLYTNTNKVTGYTLSTTSSTPVTTASKTSIMTAIQNLDFESVSKVTSNSITTTFTAPTINEISTGTSINKIITTSEGSVSSHTYPTLGTDNTISSIVP
jgi:hypothetical protein